MDPSSKNKTKRKTKTKNKETNFTLNGASPGSLVLSFARCQGQGRTHTLHILPPVRSLFILNPIVIKETERGGKDTIAKVQFIEQTQSKNDYCHLQGTQTNAHKHAFFENERGEGKRRGRDRNHDCTIVNPFRLYAHSQIETNNNKQTKQNKLPPYSFSHDLLPRKKGDRPLGRLPVLDHSSV